MKNLKNNILEEMMKWPLYYQEKAFKTGETLKKDFESLLPMPGVNSLRDRVLASYQDLDWDEILEEYMRAK